MAELRQHNKLNGVDSSSLECDDPDASIQSLPHNACKLVFFEHLSMIIEISTAAVFIKTIFIIFSSLGT